MWISNTQTILIDPVLTETFQAGHAAVRPARTIDMTSLLRRVVAVVVTHSHPGHLEVESLGLLPESLPILHVEDPSVEAVLVHLGFSNRTVIRPWEEVTVDRTTLLFTPQQEGGVRLVSLSAVTKQASGTWLTQSRILLNCACKGSHRRHIAANLELSGEQSQVLYATGEWISSCEALRVSNQARIDRSH